MLFKAFLVVTAMLATTAQAQQVLEYRFVYHVQERVTRQFHSHPGVNGVHIISCHPKTRERVPSIRGGQGIWCFLVTTNTQSDLNSLKANLKGITSLEGIPLTFEVTGRPPLQ